VKVFLARAVPEPAPSAVGAFRELAAASRHELAATPEEADLLLFPDCHLLPHDPGLRAIRRHELLRAFPDRTLVYDERDLPWAAWPGVYVSMPRRRLRPEFQEPWAYYTVPSPPADVADAAPPDLLFSFVGSRSHRVRRDVLALRHARAVVEDVGRFTFYAPGADHAERRRHFHETLLRSKFVLCPRGKGTSSIRLYEVLAAGRVPVIVADDWAAPEGPEWGTFAIRWPEDRVAELPDELAAREPEFEQRAAAARRAYEEWFAPERAFDRVVEACARLLEREAPARFPARGVRGTAYGRAQWDHARWCTRGRAVRAVRRLAR
jgi:hypothetical protein